MDCILLQKYPEYNDEASLITDIWRQLFSYVVRAHFLGFGGKTGTGGSDLHVENFRILLTPERPTVKNVGDLETYLEAKLEPSSLVDQVRRDIWDFAAAGADSKYSFGQTAVEFCPMGISEAEAAYQEHLVEAKPDLERVHAHTQREQTTQRALLTDRSTFDERTLRLAALREIQQREKLLRVQEKLLTGIF